MDVPDLVGVPKTVMFIFNGHPPAQLCDLVQMRSSSVGTTVRLHAWK